MQRPVERSQVLTTPSLSLEMAIPALVCRLTDWIEGNVIRVDLGLVMTWSVDETGIART